MTDITTTDGWFIRMNYDNGDVLDRQMRGEASACEAARTGSLEIKAEIDVCHGATVVATYRDGTAQ
jgi:hypothetical protein